MKQRRCLLPKDSQHALMDIVRHSAFWTQENILFCGHCFLAHHFAHMQCRHCRIWPGCPQRGRNWKHFNQPINLTIVTIVIFEGERSTTMYNSKTMQNKHLWSFLPPRHFRSEVSSFWAVKCLGIPCRICWTAWESQSCLHWTLVDCESWVD